MLCSTGSREMRRAGQVPSGKKSQSVWNPRNCEPYFRNLIAAFV